MFIGVCYLFAINIKHQYHQNNINYYTKFTKLMNFPYKPIFLIKFTANNKHITNSKAIDSSSIYSLYYLLTIQYKITPLSLPLSI